MTTISRRSLMGSALVTGLAFAASRAGAESNSQRTLPLKVDFYTQGIYLASAATHPLSLPVLAALQDYNNVRFTDPRHMWVTNEVRDKAASLFAQLINAAPADIAIVPSTLTGENLIHASLGIRPGDKVVTDAFHYFGSLAKYALMRKEGVDVKVVTPRGIRITPEDLEAAITHNTRLVAVSLVASHCGFVHDLKQLCEIAHRRGALVYADMIQAAGAIPIDVKDSGVDYACAGGHKWLQGDNGAAFLYVRPEALGHLRQVQMGWRQVDDYQFHAFPFAPPGPAEGSWRVLPTSAATLFEVSSFSYSALWSLRASLAYVLGIGVDAIAAHRRPLMSRLYDGMRELNYEPLTQREQNSPIASFARATMDPRVNERCLARQIKVGFGDGIMRISPSVFNDTDDIEAFLEAARV
jgi:selenocysteine lyase/cysteine desulfurase